MKCWQYLGIMGMLFLIDSNLEIMLKHPTWALVYAGMSMVFAVLALIYFFFLREKT